MTEQRVIHHFPCEKSDRSFSLAQLLWPCPHTPHIPSSLQFWQGFPLGGIIKLWGKRPAGGAVLNCCEFWFRFYFLAFVFWSVSLVLLIWMTSVFILFPNYLGASPTIKHTRTRPTHQWNRGKEEFSKLLSLFGLKLGWAGYVFLLGAPSSSVHSISIYGGSTMCQALC